MKKLILAAFAVAALAGFSAHADDGHIDQPLWNCALTFQAEGGGLQILVGHFVLRGQGNIHCADVAGNSLELPVKVTIGGAPLAPNLAIGHFHVSGIASGIGLATGPEALIGKYYTLSGQVAAVVGGGANLEVRGASNDVSLNVGLAFVKGWGAQVGFDRIMLEPLN